MGDIFEFQNLLGFEHPENYQYELICFHDEYYRTVTKYNVLTIQCTDKLKSSGNYTISYLI